MYEKNVDRVEEIVKKQNEWRSHTVNLIASENVMSRRARAVMGSDFAHRYAEGHPGERYYQGTDMIDEIETRVKQHIKTLFHCKHAEVRPISGTVANDAVFSRFIDYNDVVLVHSTPGGGHISHHRAGSVGKYTKNIVNIPLAKDGYRVDVDRTVELIRCVHAKVIIFGRSLFLFPDPVAEVAEACERNGTIILYDAAHVLGLIAGGQFQDPLREGAFLMTGSTHKTFPGSQRGIVLSNMGQHDWSKIDKGAFPGSSSNHHLDTLVALAIATYEMLEFGHEYAKQVVTNAKTFAEALASKGFDVQAKELGFTESHQVAVNVSRFGGGDEVARVMEDNNIILNMNLLPFEPLDRVNNPAGIRLGVQEMTRVGMKEDEMKYLAELFEDCLVHGHYIGDKVKEFRSQFQDVCYSFDKFPSRIADAAEAKGV